MIRLHELTKKTCDTVKTEQEAEKDLIIAQLQESLASQESAPSTTPRRRRKPVLGSSDTKTGQTDTYKNGSRVVGGQQEASNGPGEGASSFRQGMLVFLGPRLSTDRAVILRQKEASFTSGSFI